jgi:hypothetical protein
MPDEKRNNGLSWRNKLAELENLPVENFNKELAWNKLQERLQLKPAKKRFAWYMAAAVILLVALIIPFMIHYKKETVIVTGTFINQPKKISTFPLVNDKLNRVKIVNNDLPKKNTRTAKKKPDQQDDIPTNNVKLISKFRLDDSVSDKLTAANVINTLEPIDTSKNISLVTFHQRKQLKVVHINELGDPDEDASPITRNSDKHSFQLKFGKQEVFVNTSLASRSPAITILKMKTSAN